MNTASVLQRVKDAQAHAHGSPRQGQSSREAFSETDSDLMELFHSAQHSTALSTRVEADALRAYQRFCVVARKHQFPMSTTWDEKTIDTISLICLEMLREWLLRSATKAEDGTTRYNSRSSLEAFKNSILRAVSVDHDSSMVQMRLVVAL